MNKIGEFQQRTLSILVNWFSTDQMALYKNIHVQFIKIEKFPLTRCQTDSAPYNMYLGKSYLLQFSSSELSPQSFWLSHLQWSGIQLLFLHWYSWGPQVFLSVIKMSIIHIIADKESKWERLLLNSDMTMLLDTFKKEQP